MGGGPICNNGVEYRGITNQISLSWVPYGVSIVLFIISAFLAILPVRGSFGAPLILAY
jgi:hypothetical protein